MQEKTLPGRILSNKQFQLNANSETIYKNGYRKLKYNCINIVNDITWFWNYQKYIFCKMGKISTVSGKNLRELEIIKLIFRSKKM